MHMSQTTGNEAKSVRVPGFLLEWRLTLDLRRLCGGGAAVQNPQHLTGQDGLLELKPIELLQLARQTLVEGRDARDGLTRLHLSATTTGYHTPDRVESDTTALERARSATNHIVIDGQAVCRYFRSCSDGQRTCLFT